MITVDQIPDYTDKSHAGLEDFWRGMAELGAVFHPDDPPESILEFRSEERLFTAAACRKFEGIVEHMLNDHGEEAYQAAQRELMFLMGYKENAAKNGWVPISG